MKTIEKVPTQERPEMFDMPAAWCHQAAERRARLGQPVTALLFQHEALRMEAKEAESGK